jgi:hypothetical protein
VLQEFRSRGLFETRRGSVQVRERAALKKVACNCNELVKSHFDEVLAGVYPNGGS